MLVHETHLSYQKRLEHLGGYEKTDNGGSGDHQDVSEPAHIGNQTHDVVDLSSANYLSVRNSKLYSNFVTILHGLNTFLTISQEGNSRFFLR